MSRDVRIKFSKKHRFLLWELSKSADVRLAQYETGVRTPKRDITTSLAGALDVSPQALTVPDIDSYIGLAHTLFTLEDVYGLTVSSEDEGICLRVKPKGQDSEELLRMLEAWRGEAAKMESGEITREEYDRWRYYYPRFDTAQRWSKVSSQTVSDVLVDSFKDRTEDDK